MTAPLDLAAMVARLRMELVAFNADMKLVPVPFHMTLGELRALLDAADRCEAAERERDEARATKDMHKERQEKEITRALAIEASAAAMRAALEKCDGKFKSLGQVGAKDRSLLVILDEVLEIMCDGREIAGPALASDGSRAAEVLKAAAALQHQCDIPVEDYRKWGGSFDGPIARDLICGVLAAVAKWKEART
jgi:hypothetical protein